MSASSDSPPQSLLGRLVQPTQGVETRQLTQRRGEIAFLNAQTLSRAASQGNLDETPSSQRVTKKTKKERVRFSSPEVTGSVTPEYFDALENRPLPKIVCQAPAKGLKQRFGSLSNLLFSPRHSSPIRRQPSPGSSLTWDNFPLPTPSSAAAAANSSSSGSDEDADTSAAAWPQFAPVHRRNLLPPTQLVFDTPDNADPVRHASMLRPAVAPVRPPAPHGNVPARQVGDPQGQPLAGPPQPPPQQVDAPAVQPPARQPNLVIDAPAVQPPAGALQPPPQQVGAPAVQPPAGQPNLVIDVQPGANLPPPGVLPPDAPGAPDVPPPFVPVVQPVDPEDDPPFAMSSALIPAPFRGLYTEDSQEWLDTASWYVQTQRAPTELNKIALVGILLLDDAKRWFLGLRIQNAPPDGGAVEDGVITTFEQFKAEFLRRFQRDRANLWREQALVWQCRQKPGQSTQAFLNELQEVAGRARATAEQTLTAAIAGIREDVKTFCLSHELRTIQDLQRWANVYEMCTKSDSADSAIERIEKAIEKLHVRAVSPAPRSASPARQVRFADRPVTPEGDVPRRPSAPQGGRRGWNNNGGQASGGWNNGGGRGFGSGRGQPARGGNGQRRQGQPGRFNSYPFPRPTSPGQNAAPRFQNGRGPRPQFYYGGQGANRDEVCSNCGRSHPWGQCPARGSICRACQKPNHWSSVCRSVAPQQ